MSIALTVEGCKGYFQELAAALCEDPELFGSEFDSLISFPEEGIEGEEMEVSKVLSLLKGCDISNYDEPLAEEYNELLDRLSKLNPGKKISFTIA